MIFWTRYEDKTKAYCLVLCNLINKDFVLNKSYYLVRHLKNINTLVNFSKLNEHGTTCKSKICKLDKICTCVNNNNKAYILAPVYLTSGTFWKKFRKNNRVIPSTGDGATGA